MQTQVEVITPEDAIFYLNKNETNRPFIQSHFKSLCAAMERGVFQDNGAPIRFAEDGALLDGQHRLHAVVATGKSFRMVVVRGLHRDSFKTMDTGKPRTLKDILAIKKEDCPKELSAMLSQLYFYEAKGKRFNMKVSFDELLGVLERHPDCVKFVKLGGKSIILPRSILNACAYLFSRKDEELSNEFISSIIHGSNLEKGHPFFHLRQRLLQNAVSKAKLFKYDLFALAIKAFNYCRSGRMQIPLLVWRRERGEEFPEVI